MTHIKTSLRKGKASLAALTASSNMSDTAVLTSTGVYANTGGGHNFVREATGGLCVSDMNQYDLVREARPWLAIGVAEYDLAREASGWLCASDISTVSI